MKLSLATGICRGYAVVVATFADVSIFSVAEMHRNQQELRLVSEGYLHLSQDAAAIDTLHQNREKETERLVDEQGVETRRALIRIARLYYPRVMAQRISAAREKAIVILGFAPAFEASFVRDMAQRLGELERRYGEYQHAAETVYSTLEEGHPDRTRVALQMNDLKRLDGAIGRDIRLIQASLDSRIRDRVAKAEQPGRRTGVTIIALSLLAIGVGFLATAISARSLSPIRTLTPQQARPARGSHTPPLGVRAY